MKKGFTKIEALCMLACIGVVSAIILGVLSSGVNVDPASQGTAGQLLTQTEFPAPTDYIVDTAGMLTPEQLVELKAKLKAADNEKHQFGVALVKTTGNLSIEQYGIKLAEAW